MKQKELVYINTSTSKMKGNKTKRKKMPKSSSSNPATKKFREAAKRSALGHLKPSKTGTFDGTKSGSLEQTGLTLEALDKHNAAMGGFTEASVDDDSTSVGGTTFNTWATNMTGCTNATFSKVHRYINANSAVQKELLAVLAAVTEVIKEKGGEGKDLQYFGVLVSSLETADKTETQMAMAHLLSIVIKKVPVPVLQSRFAQVSKVLLEVITECAREETISPLKPSLASLASLLRVQPVSTWTELSTEHAFRAILAFVTYKKPKLRKTAQRCVKVILKGSVLMQQSPAPPFHPAAPLTAQHCVKVIESGGGLSNKVEVLHVLSLLKDIFSIFPHKNCKSLCELILRLMTLADPVVRSSCMEVLYRLFAAKPEATTMPAEMNAQILTALYDYQPSEKDAQPMTAWLRVMEGGLTCLTSLELMLGLGHMPRFFHTCMTCLLSDRHDIAKAAVSSMQALLESCTLPEETDAGSSKNRSLTALHKVVEAMEAGLSYRFHSTWSLVFQLWATGFRIIGKSAPKLLMKCLSSMGDLRDVPHFSFKGEMDQAIGQAVKSMGPRRVMEAIPLGITGNNDNLEFPRSWLLPVIRDNVTHTELGFFTSYFLPLAAKFKEKAEESTQNQSFTEAKAYEALQLQIWAMLKGFCDCPTDVKQNFQGIAKTLGSALSERSDLRMDVMAALRSLITCSLNSEEDKKEVGRFAKNYLPILFNLFTSEGELTEGVRLAVLETVRKYLQVADMQLVASFLDKCLNKLEETDVGSFRNVAMLDLSIAMIPYSDVQRLGRLLKLALARLEVAERTIQKKSYRILEEICRGQSDSCQKLLSTRLDTIHQTLVHSLSTSSPSSKAPRLRCLVSVFTNLTTSNMDFLTATLPEAMLCTKAIGVKARQAAYQLLLVLCDVFIKWKQDLTEKESLGQFVNQLLAGLAGSPHMVSATCLALTCIVHHYKGRLSGETLDSLVDSMCLLLASKTREIVKTALGFLKVVLSAFENTVLAPHLKNLLAGLHDIAVKGNMRRLAKVIYTKLIKKFGYELILKMTQESIHKFLKNLHKSTERAKKKKEADKEDSDEESDEGETFKTEPESIDELLRDTDSELEDLEEVRGTKKSLSKKKKKLGKDAFLLEAGEDEIVDFMDPSAAKKVLASKPQTDTKDTNMADKDHGFKLAADGRLIITAGTEEDGKKADKPGSDAEDDLEDLMTALEGGIKSKSRKRKRVADVGDADDEVEDGLAPKYKAGGTGIHRPLAQAKRTETEGKQFGEEYKAKKAQGDIKKTGKPDPYAYVPLNFGHLNKRKQMKVKGTFNKLVKGARKGASKGAKSKAKRSKR